MTTTKAKFFTDSRSSTPEPVYHAPQAQPAAPRDYDDDSDSVDSESIQEGDIDVVFRGVGLLPEEVYSRTLNWWRAGIRRRIVQNVEWESKALGRMQVRTVLRAIEFLGSCR